MTAPEDRPANAGTLCLLIAPLCMAAGHGVFLLWAVSQAGLPRTSAGVRGPLTLALVGWFALSIVLALAVLLMRGRLLALPAARLRVFALLAWLVTAAAFLGEFASLVTVKG